MLSSDVRILNSDLIAVDQNKVTHCISASGSSLAFHSGFIGKKEIHQGRGARRFCRTPKSV